MNTKSQTEVTDSVSTKRLLYSKPPNRMYCWVHVAENNEYGNQIGKVSAISFGSMADFEPDNFNGYAFRLSEHKGYKRIHISGKMYPIKDISFYVGNIIWNAYKIDTVSATALFNQLIKSGKWSMTAGSAELNDIIESDGVLLDGDFIRIWNEWHSAI